MKAAEEGGGRKKSLGLGTPRMHVHTGPVACQTSGAESEKR